MPSHPIDLTPLLHGARAEQLRVAGVAAGEAASGVDRAALTGAEERDPGEPRTYANGTVYRTDADGSREEIPLPVRVEATVRGADFLRQGDVALSVADGVIARIFVRGPSLAALALKQEADVERAFGPAEGRERSFGNHLYHYPSRGLVIAWRSRDGRLEYVALGADPWQEPQLGAPALLVELIGIAGTPLLETDLSSRLLTASAAEPRSVRVRHERVAALCRALGLGAPAEVINGNFLPKVLDAGRQRALDELAAQSPFPEMRRFSPASIVFTHLLHYRCDAERVIRATSGWLECGDPTLLGMIAVQNRIAGQLTTLMTDVDRWLCALLDPAGRTFPLRELIATYGWPYVDLRKMEEDEI